MKRLAAAVAIGCLAVPASGAEDSFGKTRDRAKPLEGLAAFLDRYIGSCDDPFSMAQCQKNAAAARSQMEGQLFYLILDERAQQMIRPTAFDIEQNQYRLDLTPLFEAGGRALTDGEPKSQDEEGRPRLPIMPIWAKLAPGQTPMDLERLFRTGNVRVQLVFKPAKVWRMPRKDKRGTLEGVKAKFVAIRLSDALNGDEIAVRIRE